MDSHFLRQIVNYNPETGVFTRRKKWGSKPVGSVIGGLSPQGYWQIGIAGKTYPAHRLAWLYMTDTWPDGDIDHINRNRADNRFCNLRVTTRSENLQNANLRRNNNSGVTGVCWCKRDKRWRAHIMVLGKRLNLGCYKTKEDAINARKKAATQLHPFAIA